MPRTVAVLLVWAALLVQTAAFQPWTVDDAYITFRYADHWAAGHGPVYNPGEWVEGYTSFGWLAALALGRALGIPTEPLAKVLGVLCAAAIPLLLAFAPRWGGLSERAATMAVAIAGTSGVITGWAAGGLEVAPTALAAIGIWAAHLGGKPALTGVVAVLAVWVRPELALAVAAVVADLALRREWRAAAIVAGIAAIGVGGHEVWRWTTYGWPLPNTFYAKVGTTSDQVKRGLVYLGKFAIPAVGLWLPLLAIVRTGLPRALVPCLVWAAVHVALVVGVGGDGLPCWRFFAPVVPVLALLVAAVLDRVPGGAWVAGGIAVVHLAASRLDHEQSRFPKDNVGKNGREVGLWLAANEPPDTLIATNTAGSVPYFSRLRTIDMMGLCDAHIAHREMPTMGRRKAGHEKADGAYVLSREPDLVLFGAARGRKDPFFVSDRELWNLPAFREQYVLERQSLPSGATLWLWRRR